MSNDHSAAMRHNHDIVERAIQRIRVIETAYAAANLEPVLIVRWEGGSPSSSRSSTVYDHSPAMAIWKLEDLRSVRSPFSERGVKIRSIGIIVKQSSPIVIEA